ncbi:ATP-binding cassette superfamily [Reticulomyxa filosa]|uniref:ATP-binding cassette superfamily n=1 Tax=Reticulomyxa filosa TaxID=46433 RepID=X6NP68_RETFI|nr:ATP-binding cassette superfamily [Reticulomyxa filosa]|eukprot:ETO27167.1 ATP-binding cassette superfamily [Reticulomyxa filosa]
MKMNSLIGWYCWQMDILFIMVREETKQLPTSAIWDFLVHHISYKYFHSFLFCFNPADYFLDLISRDAKSHGVSDQRIELLKEAWKKFESSKEKQEDKQEENADRHVLEQFEEIKTVRSGFLTQLQVLALRSSRQVYRDKISLIIRLFMSLFFSLFLSAIYSDTNYGQKSIQDRTGILFFVAINQSFGGMIGVVNTFTVEKAIVMRERQAKSYHVVSYYLTKFLTAVPIDAIYPIIFSCIMYWIVNLNPHAEQFILFIVITVLTSFTAMALGFLVASFAPNVDAANAMAPPFMILMILFGGFYINIKNIPVWLGWLQNLSSIRWAYMAFCINEFKNEKFHCSSTDSACISTGEDVTSLFFFAYFIFVSLILIKNVI